MVGRFNVYRPFTASGGNIRDLMDERFTVDAYISRMFLSPVNGKQNFDIVVYYDRANGLRFALDEMRAKFIQATGLVQAPRATAAVFGPGTPDGIQLPTNPGQAFDLIEKVLKSDRKNEEDRTMHTVVIIDYAESLFPNAPMGQLNTEDRNCIIKLLNWAKDPEIGRRNNPIILLSDSATRLNDSITTSASRVEMIEVLLPTPEERLAYIEYIDGKMREIKGQGLVFGKGFGMQQFAHLTAGMRKLGLEDIKLTAAFTGKPIDADTVKNRKAEIFKQEYASVIEVIDPEQGFEVVGQGPPIERISGDRSATSMQLAFRTGG